MEHSSTSISDVDSFRTVGNDRGIKDEAPPIIGTTINSRKHYTQTCPSLYKINPHSSRESTSLEILREFMSRPDGAPQQTFKIQKALQDSCSNPGTENSSSEILNLRYGQGSRGLNLKELGDSEREPQELSREKPNDFKKLSRGMGQADGSPFNTEYRCPGCNRLCKSKASFEKHQSACTHRNGALTLECRFCNRPYTYVGYLHKHEIACAQLGVTFSNPVSNSQNQNRD